MGIVVIRWVLEADMLLRKVKLTGFVKGNEHNEETSRVLLNSTLELAEIAQKSNGLLIPLSKPPIKENEEFAYFEVIFKEKTSLEMFQRLLRNRLS